MSSEKLSFEQRLAKKKEKQRREDIKVILGLFAAAAALSAWAISNGYIDNPLDAKQDSSVSIEDDTPHTNAQK